MWFIVIDELELGVIVCSYTQELASWHLRPMDACPVYYPGQSDGLFILDAESRRACWYVYFCKVCSRPLSGERHQLRQMFMRPTFA
jgi:hypothetical protein